jgi:peptide/nickel transport system permease protein
MVTTRYLGAVLLLLLPTLLLVTTINFVIVRLAPGDPAVLLAGPDATPAQVFQIRQTLGLDGPIVEQLIRYFAQLLKGDFGYSYTFKQPVMDILLPRMANTLLLSGTAFLIALPAGVAIGVWSATRPGGIADRIGIAASVIIYAMPSFLIGVLMILAFAVKWRLFPTEGKFSLGMDWQAPGALADLIRHMVLPAMTLALPNIALFARMTRSSMLEVVKQDFIVLARSKGISERRVYLSHALRNALMSVVTLVGLAVSNLLMGSAIIETVFSWPGMGKLMYEAVTLRDYNILLGGFIVFSLVQLVSSIVTDFLYTRLDPRVRY